MSDPDRVRIEMSFPESEARFQAILRSVPVGIGLVRKRVFQWVNDHLLRIVGYAEHELLGQSSRLLYESDEEFERVGRVKYRQIAEEGQGEIETRFRRKDGPIVDILLRSSVIDAENLDAGVLFIALDITDRKRAERALQESEARWRSLTENSPDYIMLLDQEGQIQFINRTVPELDRDHVIGTSMYAYLPPDSVAQVKGAIERTLATGEPSRYEVDYGPADARQHFEGQVGAIRGEGPITEVVVSARDVSDRKAAELALRVSEESLRALIDATKDDAVMLLDSDCRVQIANERAALGFGRPVQQVLGHLVWELMPPEIASSRRANVLEVARTGQPVRFEDQRGGFWYDTHLCPVFDSAGNVQAVAHFGRDITERKLMEQTLADAKESAEKANLAKSRFLAAANHDLRQPLQAMRLLLEALQNLSVDPHASDVVTDMKEALQSMEGLLNSLLDISKLEAGTIIPRRQNFHVVPFLQRLQTQFRALAQEAGVKLRVYPSKGVLYTDPILLARILQNFISNAMRHTEGESVLIGCRRAGRFRRIEVWDTGRGVPEDQLEKIFEEFYQLGNPARSRRQGLGLGLAIAQRMADLLGLRLSARSIVGKGSVFSVEVPLGECELQEPATHAQVTTALAVQQGTILVVEDDDNVLKATKRLLDSWGLQGSFAISAEEALLLVAHRRRDPCLALLDYRLSDGWTGIRLLRELRSLLGWNLPAILMTGDTAARELREVQTSGLPLLHKPVNISQLRRLIEEEMHK